MPRGTAVVGEMWWVRMRRRGRWVRVGAMAVFVDACGSDVIQWVEICRSSFWGCRE